MSQDYVLRGMICFTEGGHYLAFFRRILIKMEHLVSHDSNVKQELRKMERQITPATEWVQYNDTELKFVTQNWPGVMELCIENNFLPKVLFYEKLNTTLDDREYNDSRDFFLSKTKLADLA